MAEDGLETANLRDLEALITAQFDMDIDGVKLAVIPEGYQIVVPDIERHLAAPKRKKGRAKLDDLDSFIAYVGTGELGATAIWANASTVSLTARLNGHSDDGPGWGDHTAEWAIKFSRQWQAWKLTDRHQFTQAEFADFLEARVGEIADPPGANLHEVIRAFRVHVNATWENRISNVHNGVNLQWKEDVDTGTIVFPEKLQIVLTPFEGAASVLPASNIGLPPGQVFFSARLSFTKPDSNGRVKFAYDLDETVLQIVEDAFNAVRGIIAAKLPDVPVYSGSFAQ